MGNISVGQPQNLSTVGSVSSVEFPLEPDPEQNWIGHLHRALAEADDAPGGVQQPITAPDPPRVSLVLDPKLAGLDEIRVWLQAKADITNLVY
jgi:hypothetical protein